MAENMNDLGDLDPMKWLESLAVRQGATEGLTTEADLSVPEIDPSTVDMSQIREYTPSESWMVDLGKKRRAQAAEAAAEAGADSLAPTAPSSQASADYSPAEPTQVHAAAESMTAGQDYDPSAAGPQIGYYDHNRAYFDSNSGFYYDPYSQQYYDPNSGYYYDPHSQQYYDLNQAAYYQQQAAQQYAEQTQAAPQQAYDPSYFQRPAEASPEPAPAAGEIDPDTGIPVGMDPLLWLESLAKKTGEIDPNTLLTSADAEVADIDPSTVDMSQIREYTPSESWMLDLGKKRQAQAAQEAAAAAPPPAPEPAPAAGEIDPDTGIPVGMDPLLWLESLAKKTGEIDPSTLLTSADAEVAEIDPSTVDMSQIREYTPSESWMLDLGKKRQAQAAQEAAAAAPPPATEPEPMADPLETLSGLDDASFLDTLGAGFGQDPILDEVLVTADAIDPQDFLSELGDAPVAPLFGGTEESVDMSWLNDLGSEMSAEPLPAQGDEFNFGLSLGEPADPEIVTNEELLGSLEDLSDEELQARFENRQLTPEQELAYFMRVGQQRYAENEPVYVSDEDLPPAEATEMPDWMSQIQVVDDASAMDFDLELGGVFADDTAPPSSSDWSPSSDLAGDLQLPDFTLEAADAPFELPSPETPVGTGSLHLESYEDYQDELAVALDEEHDRLETNPDEEPSWFRQALQAVETEYVPPAASPEPEAAAEPKPWLSPSADSSEAAWFSQETSPAAPTDDWLDIPETGMSDAPSMEDLDTWMRPEAVAAAAEEPASFGLTPVLAELPPVQAEKLPAATLGALPAWAAISTPAAEAPPPPATVPMAPPPPPPPAARPTPPPPPSRPAPPAPMPGRVLVQGEPLPAPRLTPALVPASYAEYQGRLEQNPHDHGTRLELARVLARSNDVDQSLEHYQTLVDNMGELDQVSEDLRALLVSRPATPVARRLLGDVYMRQGYLQEALDAYRGALDNL
jgi:hypothetical protein